MVLFPRARPCRAEPDGPCSRSRRTKDDGALAANDENLIPSDEPVRQILRARSGCLELSCIVRRSSLVQEHWFSFGNVKKFVFAIGHNQPESGSVVFALFTVFAHRSMLVRVEVLRGVSATSRERHCQHAEPENEGMGCDVVPGSFLDVDTLVIVMLALRRSWISSGVSNCLPQLTLLQPAQ